MKFSMTPRLNIALSVLFILAGTLLGYDHIAKLTAFMQAEPYPIAAQIAKSSASDATTTSPSLPTHIDITSVGLSVDVEPGYYNYSNKTWTLSNSKASFITVTSVPNGKSGNTYIYGHNRAGIFARLNNITVGDEAVVTNSVGKKFTYSLVKIQDIKPSNVSYLTDSQKPILTLQTCSGFWSQNRRLFIFDFKTES